MEHAHVRAEGHLIDTGILSRAFGVIIEGGATYEIVRFDVGKTKSAFSTAELEVRGSPDRLRRVLDNLVSIGFRLPEEREVRLETVRKDGVAPDSFYASTHHQTLIRHAGRTLAVKNQRMDGTIVVTDRSARCVLIRDLKRGDRIVCGVDGVVAAPPMETRKAESFSFMKSETSSERAVAVKAKEVARIARAVKKAGRKIVAVPGPVVVHTGGAANLANLIRRGWIDSVLTGNALAVHDIEVAMFGTSLGVDVKKGVPVREGHMHHLRAINAIRRAGSIARATRSGALKTGIFKECVEAKVPFVLAGSIRDDGPLPDTEMDLVRAQEAYARHLKGAGLVVVLASMLHGIGVGNMTPSDVTIVCVDIHQGVMTKLLDRGSSHALGIVTDVSAFLHRLDGDLAGRPPSN